MRIKLIVVIALLLQGFVVAGSSNFSQNLGNGNGSALLSSAYADTSASQPAAGTTQPAAGTTQPAAGTTQPAAGTTPGQTVETSTPSLIFPNVLNSTQPLIETGTAVGSQAIVGYHFPALSIEPLPATTQPTVDAASTDTPVPYKDRCHVEQNLTQTKASCIYANANSKTTIVLFGDSHALSWFPAIEQIAINHKWKLVSLTMSSCWPSTIPAWNSVTDVLMKNCAIWRAATLKKISTLHPYITFVAGTRGFETIDSKGNVLKAQARQAAWINGMNTTLTSLKSASRNLVYLSDYPVSLFAPEDCLGLNPSITYVCATNVSDAINVNWLNVERVVALNNGAIWINPTEWLCKTDPCDPLMNGYIMYRDGGHLTATFAQTLWAPLWDTVGPALIKPVSTASVSTSSTPTSSSTTVNTTISSTTSSNKSVVKRV